ncbi:hypothetical protein HOF65_05440 [bacterium]|nr:hypothetical protein [bacterium]
MYAHISATKYLKLLFKYLLTMPATHNSEFILSGVFKVVQSCIKIDAK